MDGPGVLAMVISLIACGLAIMVVSDHKIAWRLTLIRQLLVIGFLLSIMNLCLAYLATGIMLRLEARFGSSTLQNYDAILRGNAFRNHTDRSWRMALLLMTLLPLSLSAAYKSYTGGTSTVTMGPSSPLSNNLWGTVGPPDMEPLGTNTGISLHFSVALPFIQASEVSLSARMEGTNWVDPNDEPPLPTTPTAYGFNVLSINDSATAVIDAPSSEWVKSIQSHLLALEKVNVSAQVLAVVSVYNQSVEQHHATSLEEDPFWRTYGRQGGTHSTGLYNGWNVGLLMNYDMLGNRDQSWCFVGVMRDAAPRKDIITTFKSSAKMYNTRRLPCNATYTVTTGDIQLANATCDVELGEWAQTQERDQQVLVNNQLMLPDYYMPNLVEFLGQFALDRNESSWYNRTATTVVATMMWSRIAARHGPDSLYFRSVGFPYLDSEKHGQTTRDIGLNYTRPTEVISSRPTMQRSWVLYFVLVLQPAVIVLIAVGDVFLSRVPMGRGFGMVAMLSGADNESLRILRGAAFSGELRRKVGVRISVSDGDQVSRPTVRYELVDRDAWSTDRIQLSKAYH